MYSWIWSHPLEHSWPTRSLKENWPSLSQKPPTLYTSSVRGGIHESLPIHGTLLTSFILYMSWAGKLQMKWVHECIGPVMPSWYFCALVLPDPWLLIFFYSLSYKGPWALAGGRVYRCLIFNCAPTDTFSQPVVSENKFLCFRHVSYVKWWLTKMMCILHFIFSWDMNFSFEVPCIFYKIESKCL